ncbi:hypothetical protein AN639_08445 [Candidatus Epulonipiscium fishelsonii]|uniref:Uncharacterized protein n=1 Tax=Candidatus Epulonipiscium fishelsonii TaxID=77094 RepID=A0ACC8XG06_9FIRM|nr:hypothetical protein AN639_08445 [Epulopiscium sp. SCG-B05WGA-EpuloA1]ONI42487.1 hypothetical protein AN396_14230 [Epulopiscium sp. SCG-B11WGA-EpuloA1]
MAIEKMIMFNLVAAQEEEHKILEQLVLSEKMHLNFEQCDNHYLTHQYETTITHKNLKLEAEETKLLQNIDMLLEDVANIAQGMDINPQIAKDLELSFLEAKKELDKFQDKYKENISSLKDKLELRKKLLFISHVLESINKKNINFTQLRELEFFEYQTGLLSYENRLQIKKNYENISAVVIHVGNVEDLKEAVYLIIYPKKFTDETNQLLKSLNWQPFIIPDEFHGNLGEVKQEVDIALAETTQEIKDLSTIVYSDKEAKQKTINNIFTRFELEKKIQDIQSKLLHGDNIFILNAWIPEKDKDFIEDKITSVTDKYVIVTKTAEEAGSKAKPPTILKNNKFFKPFEAIVQLYGLPSYNEIDPTPFFAITFCLMFGIMFGDIGQGGVYFLIGVALLKKNKVAGDILMRLGGFSMAFGLFYGSLFGLEQHQLPWLPSALEGGPLSPINIMPILMCGVAFGVAVLSVSYIFGILNSLRHGDIEHGIFGSHGIIGYIFFMSIILTGVSLFGAIPLSPWIFIFIMVLTIIIMIFKEPLTHLAQGKKPLIKGEVGEYFVESCFEALETVLAALSNAISFIRVGAFALNHAGLFLAFLVMSEMMNNIVLKMLILVIGNILILTLEGLIVFIQGLRLQYYEMFSKYFSGEGIPYKAVKLSKN